MGACSDAGSRAVPGDALQEVVAVMDRLVSPGGCPWDAEQTHESLLRYLLEETYEVVDAVHGLDEGPSADDDLAEELGDVLLQVVFHARLAAGRGAFDIDDVAVGLVAKLVRRHPHVFPDLAGDGSGAEPQRHVAPDAAGVQQRWDELKELEKPSRGPVDGIPQHLPALARADKLLSRLARADLPVPAPSPAADGEAGAVGAELFEAVRRARAVGVDPEDALRRHVRDVEAAVRSADLHRG